VEIPGSEYEIEADTVIMALGTSPNPLISSTTKGLVTNKRQCIVADDETGATSREGIFAGGDAVSGAGYRHPGHGEPENGRRTPLISTCRKTE